jgi:hypothetical protein
MAAWLRKEQRWQVSVDPDWTSLEIEPDLLKILADGLDQTAKYLRLLPVIEPILREHPDWTWVDACRWLKETGKLPPNPRGPRGGLASHRMVRARLCATA